MTERVLSDAFLEDDVFLGSAKPAIEMLLQPITLRKAIDSLRPIVLWIKLQKRDRESDRSDKSAGLKGEKMKKSGKRAEPHCWTLSLSVADVGLNAIVVVMFCHSTPVFRRTPLRSSMKDGS